MINKVSSAIFKTFLLSLMVIADLHFAFAQSTQQGIIPNGKATFLDQNGKPLTSGTVNFYIPGTTTPKTTYQDINGTIANTNPVVLDAAGRALLWGTGSYRQVVKDFNGNLIWDVTTSSAGSGSGGGGGASTGDGDLVGTIKPWAGMTAPNQYMFTYGQEVSRTTYSALFTAITSTQAVFCTTSSPILTGVGDTTNFWVGMKVEISCVPSGVTTVVAKTTNSITLAVNSNITTNTNAIFYSWGNGNGSTTFNLPDFRGIVPMGNNIMGGVASSNVTTTYFGATNPNSSGALGGGQSAQLTVSNLPPYTPTGTITNGTITATPLISGTPAVAGNTSQAITPSGSTPVVGGTIGTLIVSMSQGTSTFAGAAQGGTSVPFGVIPPSRTVNYIIKVTPDANSATASGVTSLGGMTGSIACGAGLNCTGNIVSVSATSGVQSLGGQTGIISCGTGMICSGNTIYSADQIQTPANFNAVCDGITDDAIPLQNWLNAIRDGGIGAFTAAQSQLGCASSVPLLLQASTNTGPVQGPRILGNVRLRGIANLGGTGTATSSGTNITFTGVSGTIHVGDTIAGGPTPNNVHIISQTSGTPNGNGVYVTDFAAGVTSQLLTITSDLLRIWNPTAITTSQNFYYPVIDSLQLDTNASAVANCLSIRGFWGSISKVISREGCHGGDLVQVPNWIGPGSIPDEYESQGSVGDLTCIGCTGYVFNNLIGIGASVRAGNVRGTVQSTITTGQGAVNATGGENFSGAIAYTGTGWAVQIAAPPAGGGSIQTVPHEIFTFGAGDIDCIQNGVWVAAGELISYKGHRLNIEGANTLCGNPFPQWPLTAFKFGGGGQRLSGVTVEPYITIRPGVVLGSMTAFMDFSNDPNIANLIVNSTISDQTGTLPTTPFSTLYKNINAAATIRIIQNGVVVYDNISSLPFASLPACQIGLNGGPLFNVTDSTTSTYGATIAGGGSNRVKAACLGTTWVVN